MSEAKQGMISELDLNREEESGELATRTRALKGCVVDSSVFLVLGLIYRDGETFPY